jgi:hypothetical protein
MGIVLVDKTTGQNVHQGEPWRSAIRTDFGVVGAAPDFQRDTVTINVFDSATRGQRKIEGWSLIGTNFQSRIETWHGPVYLTATAPPRTFFAILDHAGMHIAGSVPHEHLLQCTTTSNLVACRVDPKPSKSGIPRHDARSPSTSLRPHAAGKPDALSVRADDAATVDGLTASG